MQATHLDMQAALAARAVLYGLLQRVFSEAPNQKLHEQENSEVVRESLHTYARIAALFDIEKGSFETAAWPTVENIACNVVETTLEGEYNRLFVGVGKPAVCVWESVLLSGNPALFQINTLEVRRFYERYDLRSRDCPRTADDHIAIELAFLRELAIRVISLQKGARFEEGDCEPGGGCSSMPLDMVLDRELRDLLRAQADFLREHLGMWADGFAEQVVEQDRSGYFCQYARLLVSFVNVDQRVLAACLN